MKTKKEIFLEEIAVALHHQSFESKFFLDKQNMELLFSSGESPIFLEDATDEDTGELFDFPSWFDTNDLRKYDAERYLAIEPVSFHTAFKTMEIFIDTLEDVQLQNKLINALSRRHPFGNFKEVILDFGFIDQWHAFKNNIEKEEAIEWLGDNGIDINTIKFDEANDSGQ